MTYEKFRELVFLYRHLINQLDQKIGGEKKILKMYVIALQRKIDSEPLKDLYYRELRNENDRTRF